MVGPWFVVMIFIITTNLWDFPRFGASKPRLLQFHLGGGDVEASPPGGSTSLQINAQLHLF